MTAVYYDGLRVKTHVSLDEADERQWIEAVRSTWMNYGWHSADPAIA